MPGSTEQYDNALENVMHTQCVLNKCSFHTAVWLSLFLLFAVGILFLVTVKKEHLSA